MSDKELSKAFGTSIEEIDADVAAFENGDWGDFEFGEPIDGRPQAKMKTTSLKFYDSELAAIDAAAKKEGVSRSAFVRRACGNELVALA